MSVAFPTRALYDFRSRKVARTRVASIGFESSRAEIDSRTLFIYLITVDISQYCANEKRYSVDRTRDAAQP